MKMQLTSGSQSTYFLFFLFFFLLLLLGDFIKPETEMKSGNENEEAKQLTTFNLIQDQYNSHLKKDTSRNYD